MDRSAISLSRPILNRNASGRALIDRDNAGRQRTIRLRRSSRGFLTTHLDTSNFYGSIYTHAVDWAVRGKPNAKAGRFDYSLGRMIDYCLQQSRDGQTAGIAIGPETSRIISEVVMAAVDRELITEHDWIASCAVRYIDDVTIYADSSLRSIEFVTAYLEHLSRYELTLNTHKTRQLQYVEPPDPSWRVEVLRMIRSAGLSRKSSSLVSILSAVLDLAQTAGSPAPIRYFLTSTPRRSLNAETWEVFQDLLAIAIRADGITLAHAHQLLIWAKDRKFISKFKDLEANLYHYMETQVTLGNVFEVASTINILTDIGTVIETSIAERAAELESDLVDLLLIEASTKAGRLARLRREIEARGHAADAFASGHWLLAYEVQRRRTSGHSSEFKSGEWKNLAKAGVSFIRDPAASPMSRWYLTRLAARTHRTGYSER